MLRGHELRLPVHAQNPPQFTGGVTQPDLEAGRLAERHRAGPEGPVTLGSEDLRNAPDSWHAIERLHDSGPIGRGNGIDNDGAVTRCKRQEECPPGGPLQRPLVDSGLSLGAAGSIPEDRAIAGETAEVTERNIIEVPAIGRTDRRPDGGHNALIVEQCHPPQPVVSDGDASLRPFAHPDDFSELARTLASSAETPAEQPVRIEDPELEVESLHHHDFPGSKSERVLDPCKQIGIFSGGLPDREHRLRGEGPLREGVDHLRADLYELDVRRIGDHDAGGGSGSRAGVDARGAEDEGERGEGRGEVGDGDGDGVSGRHDRGLASKGRVPWGRWSGLE